MSKVIRLVIADDHAVVRDGLVALMEDESDISVVAQAGTGQEALAVIRKHRPDIALLDITMPDMNGLKVAKKLSEEAPEVKAFILTMHEEETFFFEALRAGAAGYLLKGSPSDELLSALRAVHEGGVFLPPELAGELVQDYLGRHPQPQEDGSLTPREQEVLMLIAQGHTNAQIANQLTLSINTIKTHRLHIYQKLDLHDRASLVDYALRRGILQA